MVARIVAALAAVAVVAAVAERFLVAQSTDIKQDYARPFAVRARIDGTVHNLPDAPSWLSDGATALSSAAHAAYTAGTLPFTTLTLTGRRIRRP